ncbi:hypothetical protein [Streptomyces sp. NPDC048659]|uniref:hypothetical protein n=1 Tax=Streptomyces sp. NPDC048659 TaxID=3155489 RepID=UPI00343D70F3
MTRSDQLHLPLYMRVGGGPECLIGDLALPMPYGTLKLSALRAELANARRTAAEAIENPTPDEEVPDAAA